MRKEFYLKRSLLRKGYVGKRGEAVSSLGLTECNCFLMKESLRLKKQELI
jgi:hypothetical protein